MFNYLEKTFTPLNSYEKLRPNDNLDSWTATTFVNYPLPPVNSNDARRLFYDSQDPLSINMDFYNQSFSDEAVDDMEIASYNSLMDN